jgi:hypothetical protein
MTDHKQDAEALVAPAGTTGRHRAGQQAYLTRRNHSGWQYRKDGGSR